MSPSFTLGRRGKVRIIALLAALAAALALFAITGTARADATLPSVTATTSIQNRPDGGNGGVWAYDTMDRTLTVAQSANQTGDQGRTLTYEATITDSGSFHGVIGALAPNQSTPGVKVASGVEGSIGGSYTLTLVAPSADTLTGTIPATEDDNFGTPKVSTTNWPTLAFSDPSSVVVTGGAYSWTYTDAKNCQNWTDSSTNGDGNTSDDGNITGVDGCKTTIASIADQTVTVGTAYSLQVNANTNSSDKTLAYKATGLPHGLVISASTGLVSGTPAKDAVGGTVTVTATDFGGVDASTSFKVTVNQPAPTPSPTVTLSHGHGQFVTNNREKITFDQSGPAWDKFTIVGPGGINGHVGWVHVTKSGESEVTGFYSGLLAHHGYTVFIQPEKTQNGAAAGPQGHVYFVS